MPTIRPTILQAYSSSDRKVAIKQQEANKKKEHGSSAPPPPILLLLLPSSVSLQLIFYLLPLDEQQHFPSLHNRLCCSLFSSSELLPCHERVLLSYFEGALVQRLP